MLTAREIIVRARINISDEQETGFSNDALLGYVNDGIRILRRTLLDTNPDLLIDYDGTLHIKAGETQATITDAGTNIKLSAITCVRINGRKLQHGDFRNIQNLHRRGVPCIYYTVGSSKIGVYPAPDEPTDVTITGIRDQNLLTSLDDASPFSLDIDDFLVEYVGVRAAMTDEFDVSQETQLLSQITAQVENYARNMLSPGITVDGVWDKPHIRRDYGKVVLM